MAIQDFGQGLLNRQRTQIKRRDKEARKAQGYQALGAVAGSVGNAFLKSKTQDFIDNEESRADILAIRRATKAYESTDPVHQQMLTENKSSLQFHTDLLLSQASPRILETLENDKLADFPEIQEYIRNTLTPEAKKQADNFDAVRANGALLGTPEQYIATRTKAAEKMPSNIFEWAGQTVINKFKGKTKEDVEKEILAATKSNTFKNDTAAFNTAYGAYSSGRGLSDSIEIAQRLSALEENIMGDNEDNNAKYQSTISTTINYQATGEPGKFIPVTVTKINDRRVDGPITRESKGTLVDLMSPAGRQQALVDNLQPLDSTALMGTLTYEARAALATDPEFDLNPKTAEDYMVSFTRIIAKLDDPANIRDEAGDDEVFMRRMVGAAYMEFLMDSSDILGNPAFNDDPEAQGAELVKVMQQVIDTTEGLFKKEDQ